MDTLSTFREVTQAPEEYLRGLAGAGSRVIGHFCSYTPEELILAAGAHPARLFGGQGEITRADAHLQSYCCSLVRGALEATLAGRLDFLTGTVFPHTCDSIQRLSDIWRLNTNYSFFADVVLPVKLNTPAARDYMIDVLARFRNDLNRGLGVEITPEELREAIVLLNKIRARLGALNERRSVDPGLIHGQDLLAIFKGAMIMDRRELPDRLDEVLADLDLGAWAWPAGNRKRIVLSGGICDHPDLYALLEEAGGVVVGDDLCTGSRYFDDPVAETGDPLVALADRYLTRPICPAKHLTPTTRADHLVSLAKTVRADGVVFVLLKFCDPHGFDYPYLKAALDREGLPNMLIEIEAQNLSAGALGTRLETFIQMI